MKMQLSKTETSEGRGRAKRSASVDLTAAELFSGEPRGCPAIRLCRRKEAWAVQAVGFVSPPEGELPTRWEDMPHQPRWELPPEFQSPHAALVVNSPLAAFAQATADTIAQDMARGLPAEMESRTSVQSKRRIGLRRPEAAKKQEPPASARKADLPLPEPGAPVSANGMRFAARPAAEQGFHLEASLPEFQALWLARLLPEGKRPTASSIQLHDAALMASVLAQPDFLEAKGSALAVFVGEHDIHFAGYKAGEPVLWRQCPGSGGATAMRLAVKRGLGVEDELVDSVLNDTLIDPRGALEPFLHPVFDELELARAYLADRHAVRPPRILLMGLTAGASYWCDCARAAFRMELAAPDVFAGVALPAKMSSDGGADLLTGPDAVLFLPALGAALAAAEVET